MLVDEGRVNVDETLVRNQRLFLFREGSHLENRRLRELFLFELWIDGGCAVRFRDLSFHYISYHAKKETPAGGQSQFFANIEARDAAGVDDVGLIIEFKIHISPEEHARLL